MFPAMYVIDIYKTRFSQDANRIMLLYLFLHSSLTFSYSTLGNLLSDVCLVDVVLRDFKTDSLNCENIKLQRFQYNYTFLVNEPTHISDSLTDHVRPSP